MATPKSVTAALAEVRRLKDMYYRSMRLSRTVEGWNSSRRKQTYVWFADRCAARVEILWLAIEHTESAC